MLKNIYLAMKLLWREWRAGEWAVVFFALLLAVSITTAMHFYTDRLERGLDQQSAKFLGGDLVVSSSSLLPTSWINKAASLKLSTAEVWSYPSVVGTKTKLQLVNIQAVSDSYPLYAPHSLQLTKNTIAVEPRLLPLLLSKLNDTVTIGAEKFIIKKPIVSDLDTLSSGWLIAPRVMMRLEDVAGTKTVLPGSRVNYRLLLAGKKESLQAFRQWILPQLKTGQTLLDIHNQKTGLRNIIQHAENYLQLVLLVCLMMSGVAIAMSIQQYMRRHYAHVALWRTLAAKQSQIVFVFILQLLTIAFSAGCLGIVLGYLLQGIFLNLFQHYLNFSLPDPDYQPIILGFIVSIFLLFCFALPVIKILPKTSPLYIWREEVAVYKSSNFFTFSISLGLILFFIFWFMDFSLLALHFIDVLIICLGFLYVLSLLLLGLFRLIQRKVEGTLRQGISQFLHHPRIFSLQFMGFSLILTFIIVLGLLRNHIVESWQQTLPPNTPNYFAINIAPADVAGLQKFFQDQHIAMAGLYPMIKGRLIALNNQPILNAIPEAARSNNALHRELNLSWMWKLPPDNKIVNGRDWLESDKGKQVVSIERDLAADLNLKIGDQLTFQIGDQRLSAHIINFRTLEWTSFHPNFFIIFPPGLFNAGFTTYITSFYLFPSQTILLNKLIEMYPNITIIDVASLLQQMQALVNKITLAMQYIFLFALAAGGLIFFTSLQASSDERKKTYYLLRVLGASQRYIQKSLIVEFGCLILSISVTSYLLAILILRLLVQQVFSV